MDVEDVWDRDLLHVTYEPGKTTVERMLKTIEGESFKAEVK